jgi:hypothetical protein
VCYTISYVLHSKFVVLGLLNLRSAPLVLRRRDPPIWRMNCIGTASVRPLGLSLRPVVTKGQPFILFDFEIADRFRRPKGRCVGGVSLA